MNPRFPMLRLAGTIYRVLGWILVIIGVLALVVGVIGGIISRPLLAGVGAGVGLLLSGIGAVIIGEGVAVALAIEENTRAAAEALQSNRGGIPSE